MRWCTLYLTSPRGSRVEALKSRVDGDQRLESIGWFISEYNLSRQRYITYRKYWYYMLWTQNFFTNRKISTQINDWKRFAVTFFNTCTAFSSYNIPYGTNLLISFRFFHQRCNHLSRCSRNGSRLSVKPINFNYRCIFYSNARSRSSPEYIGLQSFWKKRSRLESKA